MDTKVCYPAVFTKEESGYSVWFPDLPEAITQGDSMGDAIRMAEECLGMNIIAREEDHEPVPNADFRNIELKEGQMIVPISIESLHSTSSTTANR